MEEAKRRRYDRQLRIWGEHGQGRLEACKVCLLHCGPTGVEAIKNLVLGGIHSFTLVDDANVTAKDLGNNFFVHQDDLGKSRASAVAAHLHSLNHSVKGSFVDERVDDVVNQNPYFFKDFTVVVASNVSGSTLSKLDQVCRSTGVSLVSLNTHGLVGTVRTSKTEQTILEAKPEEHDFDFRVNKPWPELLAFARKFAGGNFKALTETQRARVPWAVTLINAFDEMQTSRPPQEYPMNSKEYRWTSEDRSQIKSIIKKQFMDASAQTKELGDAALPENCGEALSHARHAWKPPGVVPSPLLETLSDAKLDNLTCETDIFWFLLAGLREFLTPSETPSSPSSSWKENLNEMPLEGSIPDMTSTTEWYVALQKLYRDKAHADAAAVCVCAKRLLVAAGRSASDVTDDDARFFCKHAVNAHVIRWRTVEDELKWASGAGAEVAKKLNDSDPTVVHCAARYVVGRAVDVFLETRGRFPGSSVSVNALQIKEKSNASNGIDQEMTDMEHVSFGGKCDVPGDTIALRSIVETLLNDIGVEGNPGSALDDLTTEAVRCAGGEPHAVAAVVGGIGAQEVIKLVTQQFTPCAHTLVYDAAKAVTATVL
tara:strand:- start:4753 stop:6546 length:1794 start_codon:yes stop_codon:yes gene_type:complete